MMKDTIIPLIGEERSGKTKTLRAYFGLPLDSRKRIGKWKIKNTLVICYFFGSSQELCYNKSFGELMGHIEKRLKYSKIHCEREGCDDFILLLPTTYYEGKRGASRIKRPISLLEDEYTVRSVYLQKLPAVAGIAELMKELKTKEIESTKNYGRQARDLHQIVKKFLR